MKGWWLLVVGMTLWSGQAMSDISVLDDQQNRVTLETKPERIISLAPHVTEMLFAVGAGEKIVGAVAYSDYPEAAKKIPRVGGSHGSRAMDLERIIALQPDLVVGWLSGNGEETLQRLRKLGLTVYATAPRELDQVASNLERLGELTGNKRLGLQEAEQFRQRLKVIQERYHGRKPVRLFYQLWNDPYYTINGEHIIGKVMKMCGAANIFAELPTLAPQVGLEAILQRDPEVIIASGMAAERPAWLDDWQRWPELSAVKDGHLYSIDPNIINRHTPRILQGAELMCQYLERARQAKE